MGKKRKGNLSETLKQRGYRLTVPREVIINLLNSTEQHLSAEDIYLAIHDTHPGIGFTTVYRTLDLFLETGIVQKFEFGHGRAKYELTEVYGKKNHHHHLICRKCRSITDYADFAADELEFMKRTETGLQKKYGFAIEAHVLHFFGLCVDCKKQ